jgi:hypothetical protein
MRGLVDVDESTETSSKERPSHLRECKEQECSATEGIDSPQSWEGEDKVDEAETE